MFAGIAPLFVLILAGFVSVRSGYVDAASMRPVGAFVLKVALPALIVSAVGSVPLSDVLNPGFLGAFLTGSLVSFGLGYAAMRRVFGTSRAATPILALGMSLSNSGFMGLPVVASVVGAQAPTLLAQCMLVENFVMIPLALILSEGGAAGGGETRGAAFGRIAWGIARNPIVMSVLAALAFNLSGLTLPGTLDAAIDLLAHTASPVALFVIGGTVASLPLAGVYGRASTIVAVKLLAHPALVFACLSAAPGVDRTMVVGGTLFAAVPMLSVFPIFGQKVGMELVAATAQMVATVASFATLSLAIWLLAA